MKISILTIIILVAAVFLAVYFAVSRTNGRQSRRRLFKKGISIADTPAVVQEIRQIAQLVTSSFFIEKIFVEKKTKDIVDNKVSNYVATKLNMPDGLMSDEICLIAKGQIRAGYDFKKISESDITINGKTLTIKLPEPEILDAIINPKGWDFYVEEGSWTDEDIAKIKAKAKDSVIEEAKNMGVLELAKSSGEQKLKALFMSFGFTDVNLA